MKILLIGIGRWGANHLRVLHSLPVELFVSELDGKRLESARKLGMADSHLTTDYRQFAAQVDGVVIVTPAQSHFPLVPGISRGGQGRLCRKTAHALPEESKQLAELAEKRGAFSRSAIFSDLIRPRNGFATPCRRGNSAASISCAAISAGSNDRATTAA